MTEALSTAANVAVLVFVVMSLLTMGLDLKLREVTAPLTNLRIVSAALFVNFLLAPLLAMGVAWLLALREAHAAGLVLLGAAAGAPFLPKLAYLARGDVALSVAVMLLLTVGTILFLPLAMPWLLPGVQVEPLNMARSLFLTMLLPLAAGMALKSFREGWNQRLRPITGGISNLSMLAAVILLIGLHAQSMAGMVGSRAAAASILFVALTCLAGYLLGGPRAESRCVLSLGAGQRNIAAALVVATGSFADPEVALMLILATFAGLIPLLAIILFVRQNSAATINRLPTP